MFKAKNYTKNIKGFAKGSKILRKKDITLKNEKKKNIL